MNPVKRILIIGGYGNFAGFITKTLAQENNIQLIIAGRSLRKAQHLAASIHSSNAIEPMAIDIKKDIQNVLESLRLNAVIHTCGPFQSQGYEVAQACINSGLHYIDIADGRSFVKNITTLNEAAKAKKVLVISGASSVPCLTSALIDYYLPEFSRLENLDYGITTAQKTAPGPATTAAILGYTGKPFKTLIEGEWKNIYGWQSIHARRYANLGLRLLGNCDVPDLDLFPVRYPHLKTIRFYAGLEIPFIHITLWLLSWLVRTGLINSLRKAAPLLLRLSFLFDRLGTANSAFHMRLSGKDLTGSDKTITFELIARSGDGSYIPCIPAILLAKKLVNDEISATGAYACVGLISRDEYLNALRAMDIAWHTQV